MFLSSETCPSSQALTEKVVLTCGQMDGSPRPFTLAFDPLVPPGLLTVRLWSKYDDQQWEARAHIMSPRLVVESEFYDNVHLWS